MKRFTLLAFLLVLICCGVNCGFLGSHVAYDAGFPLELPFSPEQNCDFAANEPQFAAPLPVVSVNAHQPYANFGYAAPTGYKVRNFGGDFGGFGPFSAYASVRSHHKFAYPSTLPSFYSAPAPVPYGPSPITYNGFQGPRTVVKFGQPITTTTTTYASAAAGIPLSKPFGYATGW